VSAGETKGQAHVGESERGREQEGLTELSSKDKKKGEEKGRGNKTKAHKGGKNKKERERSVNGKFAVDSTISPTSLSFCVAVSGSLRLF
jgi:hypothetical protein